MSRLLRVPLLGLVFALATVVGVVGGIAIADNHDDVFYACEKDGNLIPGSITVNEAPDCKGSSVLRSWNSVGPPGDDGADGAGGEPGPQGPKGDPGDPGEGLSCANQEAIRDQIPAFEVSESCKLDIFAIAYINVDMVDGFTEGTDILIAKLIDGPNNDGLMGAGDLVVTDKYPLDFDATATGQFRTTSHPVTGCGFLAFGVFCSTGSNQFEFKVRDLEEGYWEYLGPTAHLIINDNWTACGPLVNCDYLAVPAIAPSDPAAPVSPFPVNRTEDDLFIDVDIFVTP